MKLTIDTKHDSHEEIKHAIEILNQVLTRKGGSFHATPTQEASPEATTNMMSMFADDNVSDTATTESVAQTAEETAPDFSSFLNLASSTEKKEENSKEPKVEYF